MTDGSTVDDYVKIGERGEAVYEAFTCREVDPEVFNGSSGGGREFGCSGGMVGVGDL